AVDPSDYQSLLRELESRDGHTSLETRSRLAAKAFAHTARYDTMVSGYLLARHESRDESFPQTLPLVFEKIQDLRYGENPHQRAAFYRDVQSRDSGVATAKLLQGKDL